MTPAVEALIPQLRAYYAASPDNAVGGSLHIVLDDGNLSSGSVRFCHDYALEIGDAEGARLALLILDLSHEERRFLSVQRFYPWDNPWAG